jgi:plastocyanin
VLGAGNTMGNVLVSVAKGLPAGKTYPAPKTPVTIDQRGCQYIPHVVGVMVSQPVKLLNNDGILHNVRTSPGNNPPINMAQPKFRRVMTTSFARPDIVKVSCDVHVWMTAWLFVAGHPYHAVSGDDGGFALDGVPPGTYTLRVWHETLGTRQQPVTVPPAGAADASFTFGG